MKTNGVKKLGSMILALAIAFTTVFATVEPVKADTTVLYSSSAVETGTANVEVKHSFTVPKDGYVGFCILTDKPCSMKLALYDSVGNYVDDTQNPRWVSAGDNSWQYDSEYGQYVYVDPWTLSSGDYSYGVTFNENTDFLMIIGQVEKDATISQKTATITSGYSTKLYVSDGTVKKWSSKNSSIAKVDRNGKVTGKKAGKTTIIATLADGKQLKCNVTVKKNEYTKTKGSLSQVPYGNVVVPAYKANFDSKGNLVVKGLVLNNSSNRIKKVKLSVTVKDQNGNLVVKKSLGSKSVTIAPHSTKAVTYTIKKSSLKRKKADLRNSSVSFDGSYVYSIYY